ncbi:MAG: DEAD/DEAH box helicase [Candidatus Micrarchaeota archaeon]|nr:DEAD/DEAH box helicase [Candidatus Micrarchaeota archaeon]
MNDVYTAFLEEFGRLTAIQEKAIPIVERADNCLITAPPGSGKTEAAILPVLKRIVEDKNRKGVSALYITPLRALNRDLLKRLDALCGKFGVRVEVRHGDTPQSQRTKQSKNPPDILITTPETVQSILMTKLLYGALKNLKSVIVDEVHELYYNKRGAQFSIAMERLVEIAGEFQRVGISATIGDAGEAAYFLCAGRPCDIAEAKNLKEFAISISMPRSPKKDYAAYAEKFSLDGQSLARIEHIAERIKSSSAALIFANTRQVVESLGNKLLAFDKVVDFGGIGVHHSSLDKEERVMIENSFKEGRIRSIIATSSLELGIDIGNVDFVVQYGSPRQVTRMVQRMGRSGHRERQIARGEIVVASAIDAVEAAAIIELGREGVLERRAVQENPLDVLANQASAIALEYKAIDADRFFRIVRRSACFSKLERADFNALLAFAAEQRLIRFDGKTISVGGRTRRYIIEKISVIPDSIRFSVKNAATNKIISSLDEGFVYNNIEEGTTFVTKGLVWKVVSIEENVIFVEPSAEIEASIPDWEGEDIPVSHKVASRAFSFFERKRLAKLRELVDANSYNAVSTIVEEQSKYFAVEENVIFVEETDERAVLYTGLGKLANDFFAKVAGALISAEIGRHVLTKATPYAVIVEYEGAQRTPNLAKVVDTFKQYNIIKLLQSSDFVAGFDMFRYKFVQTAKLFGIIERNATITRSTAMKLISFYKDSPVFLETVRDLVNNYFDIESVLGLQKKLRDKEIRLAFCKSYGSAILNEMLRAAYFYRELLNPLVPSSTEIEEFAAGLMKKEAMLVCTYCGFEFVRKIGEFREHERIKCPNCKSPMIAVNAEGYNEVIEKRKEGARLSKSEQETYTEAISSASLVEAYGLRALLAMATYGVGIKTAARVLKLLRKETNAFVVDLISAQKQFIKTKKYWAAR